MRRFPISLWSMLEKTVQGFGGVLVPMMVLFSVYPILRDDAEG